MIHDGLRLCRSGGAEALGFGFWGSGGLGFRVGARGQAKDKPKPELLPEYLGGAPVKSGSQITEPRGFP